MVDTGAILALERAEGNRYRFSILEVKLGNDPELKGRVAAQLERHVSHISAHFESYKDCYERVYLQKRQLGLLGSSAPEAIEMVDGVQAQVIVLGYSGMARSAVEDPKQAHPAVRVRQFSFGL